MSNRYETIYIVQPDVADEQLDGIVQSFEAIIPEHKGTLLKTDKWGKRRLAYRIGPHWEGSYILHEYEGDGATQRELERRMRIHEHVIRHMTVSVDPRMAAELERRAAREKRMGDRRDDGPRGDRDRDRDRGDRDRDRGDRDRGERQERPHSKAGAAEEEDNR